eukprot:4667052-Lingulodinium_polyedra.AAC.1
MRRRVKRYTNMLSYRPFAAATACIARVAHTMRTPICGVRMVRATRAIRKPLRRRMLDSNACVCNV